MFIVPGFLRAAVPGTPGPTDLNKIHCAVVLTLLSSAHAYVACSCKCVDFDWSNWKGIGLGQDECV